MAVRGGVRNNGRMLTLRTLVRVSFLAAVAFVLMLFVEFSIPPFPAFMKYSPADVPALLGTFAMGPVAGTFVQVGKLLLYALSGKGEPVGMSANLVAGVVWVVVAGLVYARMRNLRGALLALALGALASVVVMVPANYFVFMPIYGVPREAAMPLILGATVPFNLVKGLITSVATFLLYKRVRRWL